MLVARREFSLGDRRLTPGDEITLAEQRALPGGRAEQLKRLRLVEEQYGEQVLERKVSELAKQVSELKGQVAKLTGTPKKRSPKKKAAS